MGKLRAGTKDDLLACFEPVGSQVNAPSVTCVVVDGPAIVHLLKPGTSKSFDEYANLVFVPYILSHFNQAKRVDLVWDRYICDSLKSTVRAKRGTGSRRRVVYPAPMPGNWQNFLHVDRNKAKLYLFYVTGHDSISSAIR